MREGSAFDVAEAGVYKWAVRARAGDDVAATFKTLQVRMCDTARVSEDNPHLISSNVDLAIRNDLAPFVLPVALWDLPLEQRAAILAGDLMVGNLREAELLDRKLRAHGIEVVRVPGGFKLTMGNEDAVVHVHEWAYLNVSMALTGVSVDDVAATIAEGFTGSREAAANSGLVDAGPHE